MEFSNIKIHLHSNFDITMSWLCAWCNELEFHYKYGRVRVDFVQKLFYYWRYDAAHDLTWVQWAGKHVTLSHGSRHRSSLGVKVDIPVLPHPFYITYISCVTGENIRRSAVNSSSLVAFLEFSRWIWRHRNSIYYFYANYDYMIYWRVFLIIFYFDKNKL